MTVTDFTLVLSKSTSLTFAGLSTLLLMGALRAGSIPGTGDFFFFFFMMMMEQCASTQASAKWERRCAGMCAANIGDSQHYTQV